MTKYKLTYFDFDGGRGEPIRIAFHAAGIEFEDDRISFEKFVETRDTARFRCVPVLAIDGVEVTQSNAMNRYIGRMAGLYPENDLQALYCDEALEAVQDLLHHVVHTFGLEGDELKSAREQLVDGWITTYIKGFADLLARGGGEYVADNRFTMGDLKIALQVRSLRSGTLDHVPADLVDRLAPALAEHQARIEAEPQVVAYYSR